MTILSTYSELTTSRLSIDLASCPFGVSSNSECVFPSWYATSLSFDSSLSVFLKLFLGARNAECVMWNVEYEMPKTEIECYARPVAIIRSAL